MPYSHDQPDNAARVERLGTSRTLDRQKYFAPEVDRELNKLLTYKNYQYRAIDIARAITAEDGVGKACNAIEYQLKIHSH